MRQKNFTKIFTTFLENGVGVEIKRYITYFCEQMESRVAPKKEVKKPRVGPNNGLLFKLVSTFGRKKIGTQKFKKRFFSDICYIL